MAYKQSSFSNIKIGEVITLKEKDGGAERSGPFKGSTADGVKIYWSTYDKEFSLSYSQIGAVDVEGGKLDEDGTVTRLRDDFGRLCEKKIF